MPVSRRNALLSLSASDEPKTPDRRGKIARPLLSGGEKSVILLFLLSARIPFGAALLEDRFVFADRIPLYGNTWGGGVCDERQTAP